MKNRNYIAAKVLTLIPVIIFVITALCMILASALEMPTSRGTIYTIFASIGLISIMISPVPCFSISVIGLIFAIKAVKEKVVKAIIFLVLGIFEILVSVAGAIFAIMMLVAAQGV